MTSPVFDDLCKFTRETALLESIDGLLNWDERTYMPDEAGPYRAEQITYLSGMIHQRRTDPRIGEWLNTLLDSDLAKDRHSDEGCTIHQLKREYDKRVKLPQRLVEELTRASILGQQAWVKARHDNDFASFAPHLETLYRLTREKAEATGYVEHPYDALLDDYEPGAKTSDVARVLSELKAELVPLLQAIVGSSRKPNQEVLKRHYPATTQESFGKAAASAIGFDMKRGRLDTTHHPFCSGMGPNDCRITTRYDERFFQMAFYGILHEAGHGIYDQGLRTEWYGLPPGTYVSLGIHESQSRMWENIVGRSREFWQFFLPLLKDAFPAAADTTVDDYYYAVNSVSPSLIRVEADEATYNLHIIIRFELEQALVSGQLAISDVPEAWNAKYREYLGIEPPSDADGCLQDVHWSGALIGYFPTYSLGNLYAAQFFEKADQNLGGLGKQFARGEFAPLREWLRTNIHARGQCYTAGELAEIVTGQPLSHAALIRYLKNRLGPIYGI